MDPPNILETLAAHDKVHTMAEMIEWKKKSKKIPKGEKRVCFNRSTKIVES